MGLPRSTFYDGPAISSDDAEIIARISAICEEFECYGYRRVGAALRHQGLVVNAKKIRRLMRDHGLQPRRRRRFTATTDSRHGQPVFANLTKGLTVDGPNQLWVSDITYVAIAVGFVYLAVILDAWSRRVVGYAIGTSIDARLALAALEAAIRTRQPAPASCRKSPTPFSKWAPPRCWDGPSGREASWRLIITRPPKVTPRRATTVWANPAHVSRRCCP
jgi:putative transposase